jgi:3-deoxy-D-manno-octulosonate 8-phosphate phosphatase (KDO 8-P phosphatase)
MGKVKRLVKGKKNNRLNEKGKRIKFLLLDVDGVMTDGKVYIDDDGCETKAFNIQDGHGITLLRKAGIRVGIISGRSSRAVDIRAKQLSIEEVHQAVDDKLKVYEQILTRYQLKDEEVAYIGDDLIDRPLLQRVGLSVAVANAHEIVKRSVDWVTKRDGGAGAVREVVDHLLKSQGKWSKLFRT